MRARPVRILSGWRARRLVEGGGLLVRDGAAFRMFHRADERSGQCGRVPAHVVSRLQQAPGLAVFRGDPDRLVAAQAAPARHFVPLPLPVETGRSQAVLDRLAQEGERGVRLRAAAARFRADYHLAASAGRLRTDAPKTLAAARERLASIEASLGPKQAELAEMLVLDRVTLPALRHVKGMGADEAREILSALAGLYGLMAPDQEAGSAFASA